jgi:hypothetical protein
MLHGPALYTSARGVKRGWATVVAALDKATSTSDPDESTLALDQSWDGVLLVLIYSGQLSRTFWPARDRPRYVERARGLRKFFEVADGSPLNKTGRQVRDIAEHYDERLDDWSAAMAADGVDRSRVALAFGERTVIIGLERLDLGPLLDEVDRLSQRLEEVAEEIFS